MSRKSDTPILISYATLRKAVGLLGILLPVVLAATYPNPT